MKRFILFTLCLMSLLTCMAQDIITFTNGGSVKAKVSEITETRVKYHLIDNIDGPLYSRLLSDIASITYSNGKTETFSSTQQLAAIQTNATKELTIDPNLETKLRRLRTWSIICKIYGYVNVGCGIFLIAAGNNYDYDPDYDDFDLGTYWKTLGTIATIEGGTALIVGCSLQGKRHRLMRENNLVGSIPVIQKEFKFDNFTLSPSLNLMSYRNNPADGIGAGLNISF